MEQKNNKGRPSGMSIAALITGILGLSIIPIILAVIDIMRIRRGESDPRGMVLDIAGIVLGFLGIVALIIVAISATIIFLNLSAGGELFSFLAFAFDY